MWWLKIVSLSVWAVVVSIPRVVSVSIFVIVGIWSIVRVVS